MNSIESKVRELISQVIENEEFNVWQIKNNDNLFHQDWIQCVQYL